MRGEWCYFKSYFSPEQCRYIVDTVLKRPAQDAKIGTSNGVKADHDFRRSKLRFVNKGDPELDYLFQDLWSLAIQANHDWFNIHITKLDYFQIAEYDGAEGGEYKTHHDIFYMNGDPFYHRKISCVVQLSDPNDYEGGELMFDQVSELPNAEELKMQGTAIFFPSFTRHAALPVTEGKRYSLAAWFDGPKWR